MEYVSTGGKEPVVRPAKRANVSAVPSTSSNAAAVQEITLCVKDLDESVTEEELKGLFDRVGGVKSVKLCVHEVTKESLGYGYVTFTNTTDAEKTAGLINFAFLRGNRIRIFCSNGGGTLGTLFFKHLPEELDKKTAVYIFSRYGNATSFVLELDSSGKSKGCGYVRFDNGKEAHYAAHHLNGIEIHGKKLCVDPDLQKLKFTNVCVSNIVARMTEENLIETFSIFGPIHDALVLRDEYGISKGVGFVKFEKWEDASKSVEMLDGRMVHGREWSVRRALTGFQKLSDDIRILCVRNLSTVIRKDEDLKFLFSPAGTITSCRIIRNRRGRSKGFGFVVFSTFEEAIEAICQIHLKKINGKPLVVEFARCKSDKRPSPQAQVSETGSLETTPTVASHTPTCTSGDPGLGEQTLYGQKLPMMPFRAQVPRMWPTQMVASNVAPMRMFYGPRPPMFPAQFQAGYRNQQPTMYVRRPQLVSPAAQQKAMVSRGHDHSYQARQDVPIGGAMARVVGEKLYRAVEEIAPKERVAKVTGMLLELGMEEVEYLLSSPPDSLAYMVQEALSLLQKKGCPHSWLSSSLLLNSTLYIQIRSNVQ